MPGTSVTYNCELPCEGWQLNPGSLEVKSTGGHFCSGLALPILEWFHVSVPIRKKQLIRSTALA